MRKPTKKITKKGHTALLLRDLAIEAIGKFGQWEKTKVGESYVPIKTVMVWRFTAMITTPFDGLKPNRAYGIEIWHTSKVMNLEWYSDGSYLIRTFKRGDWEKQFKKKLSHLVGGPGL